MCFLGRSEGSCVERLTAYFTAGAPLVYDFLHNSGKNPLPCRYLQRANKLSRRLLPFLDVSFGMILVRW